MTEIQKVETMLKVITALKDDWTLCDDSDADEHMVLVDGNRTIDEKLKPLKSLINKMEKEGIIFTEDEYDEREYMEIFDELTPIPFVYMYEVTDKGEEFYEKYKRD